jgi:hypothetical protein
LNSAHVKSTWLSILSTRKQSWTSDSNRSPKLTQNLDLESSSRILHVQWQETTPFIFLHNIFNTIFFLQNKHHTQSWRYYAEKKLWIVSCNWTCGILEEDSRSRSCVNLGALLESLVQDWLCVDWIDCTSTEFNKLIRFCSKRPCLLIIK